MKKISTIIAIMVLIFSVLQAQDTMYIHQNGGLITKIAVNEIDSIVFYSSATSSVGNTLTDIDGNVYKTVTIGTQTWMAENLKTTKYKDGSLIPKVTDATSWSNIETPAFCSYKNTLNADTISIYGLLYNWNVVNTGSLCPTGWHVPSDAEWSILFDYLGGMSIAGKKLKEIGNIHWLTANSDATNESKFFALPGGVRLLTANFLDMGYSGYWWTSTADNGSSRKMIYLINSSSIANVSSPDKNLGSSVRCLMDSK